MKNQILPLLLLAAVFLVPIASFAETCDEVCARAAEPGYNHANEQGNDTVCCCQQDQTSGQQVNRPQSECENNNPESPSQPSED